MSNPEIKKLENFGTLMVEEDVKDLILYNDDVNTFDFVTETLMEVCEHDLLQAEQCTLLVHYTGKCAIKKGSFQQLEPICTALLDRGLSAEIQ
jgi:ATP-dependent Clp protease adaptor protein ClpS